MAPARNAIHGSVRSDTCTTTKLGRRLTPWNTRQPCAFGAAHNFMIGLKLAQLSGPTLCLQMDHACSTVTHRAASNFHCSVCRPSRSPMPFDANQSLSKHSGACMCCPSVQSCSGTLSIGASASQPCTSHLSLSGSDF